MLVEGVPECRYNKIIPAVNISAITQLPFFIEVMSLKSNVSQTIDRSSRAAIERRIVGKRVQVDMYRVDIIVPNHLS